MNNVEWLIAALAEPGARLEMVWEGEAWTMVWSAERGDASAADPLLITALRACWDQVTDERGMRE